MRRARGVKMIQAKGVGLKEIQLYQLNNENRLFKTSTEVQE